MAVAKNDSGTAIVVNGSNVTSIDLTTFTVSAGSNLALIALLHHRFNSTFVSATSATWNGVAMTSAGVADGPSIDGRVEVFYLANPAPGNQTLHAQWTGGSSVVLGAIAFSGANQTTVINASDTVSGSTNSTTPSVAVTSSSDGATVAGATDAAQNFNSTDTQTAIYRDNSSATLAAASYGLAGSSNTHTWTLAAAANWAALGVHVLAAAADQRYVLIPN